MSKFAEVALYFLKELLQVLAFKYWIFQAYSQKLLIHQELSKEKRGDFQYPVQKKRVMYLAPGNSSLRYFKLEILQFLFG